jgi:fucose permease
VSPAIPDKPRPLVLLICYLGFISLGLPDTLLGVAWPSVRDSFSVRQSDIGWLFAGAGLSYFLSSFFAGRLLKRFNVGTLLAVSSALVALSGLNYSWATGWWLFCAGSLLHGLGSGAIDTGLNHYVAHHFSVRHMTWLHACYSVGAMLGPLIMTAIISSTGSWRTGYLIMGLALLALATLFATTRAQWNDPRKAPSPAIDHENDITERGHALRNRTVWLHVLLFFVYTGLEVSVGQWSYTVLTEDRTVAGRLAGLWVTAYWASILAGRILFGFVVERIGIDRLIRMSLVAALLGTILFAWNPFPEASLVGLMMAGFGLAAIYPCLMTRTPQRLGPEIATHAIGYQVGAAMLGAAALPSLAGWIAQHSGLHHVPLAMAAMAVALTILHETVLATTKGR